MKKELITLEQLIDDIVISISNNVKNQKLEIHYNGFDSFYSIRSYVNSIFYNLILNSIKYQKPDTSPVIHVHCTRQDQIIRIVYTDNGMGLDMVKNGNHLFELYKHFNPKVEGGDLCLYIAKAQVKILEDSITVQSEPNKGMQFTMLLPFTESISVQ